MAEDFEKRAAELGFDLTKQFLTLAFAGIAFVVGLSYNAPGAVSSLMLWLVIVFFGLSVIFGLLFLMRGVNMLSIEKSYNIYAPWLRFFSISQIVLVVVGAIFLGSVLKAHSSRSALPSDSLRIQFGSQKEMVYPIDPNRTTTVEIDSGKIKITSTK